MNEIPVAPVMSTTSRGVRVLCPYCHDEHFHEVRNGPGTEHRAPGCGMTRSPIQRLTGYRFQAP